MADTTRPTPAESPLSGAQSVQADRDPAQDVGSGEGGSAARRDRGGVREADPDALDQSVGAEGSDNDESRTANPAV
ncbi:hypothetical protein [Brevundimonas sp.]|uniref:hypothetical protein n=1 Tax=Brevundimonas sp. TaxID=1871086 RepID=UPI002FC60A6F